MRFLNCSVCDEDGGVIKGVVSDQNREPFPQNVLAICIGFNGLEIAVSLETCMSTVT